MCDFIFSFSHLEIKNILKLKTELHNNSTDLVHFLTRRNFDNFYTLKNKNKYLNLKKILTGKYLLIRCKNLEEFTAIKNKLFSLISNIEQLNLDLHFFCLVSNGKYYFKDFFILSEKYDRQRLYNSLIETKKIYNLNFILLKYFLFYSYTFRIINLKLISRFHNSMYN